MTEVRRVVVLLLVVVSVALSAGLNCGAHAQSMRDSAISKRQLKELVGQLVAEAKQAQNDGRLEHVESDIATRFAESNPGVSITPDVVAGAIATPQHRDSFIDAYVRWQLMSFDPPLPEFDDAAFDAFISQAPRMLPNPRADLHALELLRRADAAGTLDDRDLQQVREFVDELESRAVLTEQMNRPSVEFRQWVAKKLGDTGVRPRLWMLAELAARIEAGWSVADIKGRITRDLTDSVADETFTPDERLAFIMRASRLLGPGSTYVGGVTWYANDSLRLTESRSRVTAANVETWRRRIEGIRDD